MVRWRVNSAGWVAAAAVVTAAGLGLAASAPARPAGSVVGFVMRWEDNDDDPGLDTLNDLDEWNED